MHAQLAADTTCQLGEGPLWHPMEKCLYWADIPQKKLYKYDPATGEHEMVYEGRPIGAMTLQTDGSLLFMMDGGAISTWRDGQMKVVTESVAEEADSRFNDGIADPEGRVFAGTMKTKSRAGRLYRIDKDRSMHVMMEGVGCSNGLAFTADLKTMYFTDSTPRTIWKFDYDAVTGDIENQQTHSVIDKAMGCVPDGLTIDEDDCIWSARWDGYCVVHLDPDGRVIQQIDLPAKRVTSVCFGGDDLSQLYITTAGGEDRSKYGEKAGALFVAEPGVKGRAEFKSNI